MAETKSPGETTQVKYYNGIRAFLTWFIRTQQPDWDPTVLTDFNRSTGPLPFLPDLGIYETSVPPSTLKTTIAAYIKLNDFLALELICHQLTMAELCYIKIALDLQTKRQRVDLLAKSNCKSCCSNILPQVLSSHQ